MNPNKGKGPDILFTPCDPNDLGAIPISLFDLNPEELLLPEIDEKSFETAVHNIKASVNAQDLLMQQKFTEMYGELGSLKKRTEPYEFDTLNSEHPEIHQKHDEYEEKLMKSVNDITENVKRRKNNTKEKNLPTLG